MNLQPARVSPLPTLRLSLLAVALVTVLVALTGAPQAARAGVAGQLGRWEHLESGLASGQVFDPDQIGVDPIDGSVYILSNTPDFSEVKLDKFSSTGLPEGSVTLPRTAESGGGGKNFVGIAVGHKVGEPTGHVYLVQSESGLNSTEPQAKVATKVLVFSTEPSGGNLVAQAPITLPLPNSAEAIFYPNEIHVDPSNGDLVLSATALDGATPQLVRITEAGAVRSGRYEEHGTTLHKKPGGSKGEINFGFTVGNDGTTYIVANSGTSEATTSVEAFTLPPNFGAPLTLAALAGFVPAGEAEGWKSDPFGFLYLGPSPTFDGEGPQVALTKSPGGEETLFWKTGSGQAERETITIHGFSLQQQATDAVYGGGAARFACSVETRDASLAAASDGSLLVLDPGELIFEASAFPSWGFSVASFGPGGSECPGPAPSIALKVGATEPASVAAGTSVTLDAGGTEHVGSTISSLKWIIEGPGGTQTIPVPGPAPALQTAHVFATEGTYTVRLAVTTTESVGHSGSGFVGKPKKLTVTAATPGPTVSGLSPNHGPVAGGTQVTISGTNLTGATEVKFGTVVGTGLTGNTGTELKITSPSCAAGEVVDVTVTTPDGTSSTSAADHFTCDSPAGTPTVTAVGPSHGPASGGTEVTITGTNLTTATAVKFGSAAATGLTQVSSTELKATSPAGTGGSKVDVVVTTSGGTSATGSADQFSYDQPTRSLTINKVGGGSGTVTCNGAECQNSYTAGSSVQLAATAAAGSTFVGWSGGGCSGTGPCAVVLSANTVVTATFNVASGPADNNNSSTPPSNGTPSTGTTPPGSGATTKTPAQILKEKQQKALQKCKKLKGNAKAQCTKKALQIGKPKKKPAKKK